MFEQAITSDQTQIFKQMTDLALQEAANTVSSLSQVDIQIKAVSLDYKVQKQVIPILDNSASGWVAIVEFWEGDVEGQAILLMDEESCMRMIREMLNEKALLRELTEMEEEALTEIGNIVINSCLGNYLQLIKGKLVSQLPVLQRIHPNQFLSPIFEKDDALMMIELSLVSKNNQYSGYLLFTEMPWYD